MKDGKQQRAWVRPELKKLAAGAAESGLNGRADGGGGFQAS